MGKDQFGREEKAHIRVSDIARMTWVTTGHGYLEWEETRPSRCDLEWEEYRPIRSKKSGVGSNILQQNGLVSKSDTRPDRNSEVERSKNGSVSKSDTRPDRGNLALSIAGGDVAQYDVKE